MSAVQAIQAIIEEQNRSAVRVLSEKYGFDALEALQELAKTSEPIKAGKAPKAAKAPKAEKSPKKAKDPSKPKRAATGYILFGNDVRPKIKSEKPELKPKDTVREIAERWKALTADERDQWNTKAKEMATPPASDDEIKIETNSDSDSDSDEE